MHVSISVYVIFLAQHSGSKHTIHIYLYTLPHEHYTTSSGIKARLLHTNDEKHEKIKERRRTFTTERRRPCQPHLETNMASASRTGIEIRKFDSKTSALWKEIMQDVLIIRRSVESIRHIEKPTSMTIEEWKSIDEITRSTIRMYLAENVYFSMAKETTTFKLWEKLKTINENQSSSS